MDAKEMIIEALQEHDASKDTIWGITVPIVRNRKKNSYTAFMNTDVSEPSDYNEFCHTLANATSEDHFIIDINTPGGILDSAFKVIHAIQNTKAKTTAKLTGTVASAGTIIALACDEMEVSDHLRFMIHNYSGGAAGKGHEIKDQIDFSDKNLKATFNKLYDGFLSKKEIKQVIAGKDMWFNSEEVRKRWKRKQK